MPVLASKFERHPSIWYPDGNIVLVSESCMFRVHKSILQSHSPEFRKMVEIPPKSIGVDYFDGCPMIHVYDSVSDLTLFLETIYNQSPNPPFHEDNSVSLTYIATCLRMGTKYESSRVMQEALRILRLECPSSYRSLKALQYRETPLIQEIGKPGEKYITILNLARRHKLKLLTPWCIYMCIQLPVETLIRGIVGPDGQREKLSDEDLILCIQGKQELIRACMEVAERFRCDGIVCHEDHCQREMERWENRRVFSELKDDFFRPDPLGFRDVLFPMDHYKFCRACRTNIDSIRQHQQESIFLHLPSTLGIW